MGNDIDITHTSQYNSVPTSNVTADDISKKQDKLLRIFGQFDLNHDGQLNSAELAKALDYFSSFDSENDNDGTITKDEFNQGADRLNQELGLTGKEQIKAKDIKNFITKLMNLTQNDEHIDIKQLFFFIDENDENSEFDIQNLTDAEFDEDNHSEYTLKYKNGKTVKVHSDKSYEIISTDPQGNTTTAKYNNKKELQNSITTYYNGDNETTQYITSENQTIPTETTQNTNIDGVPTTSQIKYTLGFKGTEVVTTPTSESTYTYIGEDPYLVKKRDNIGTDNETTTTYSYNDNNTVTVQINSNNKRIIQTRVTRPGETTRDTIENESAIVLEKTVETTDKGEKTTEIIYTQKGRGNARIERITNPDGTVLLTEYNENNHKTYSILSKNGHELTAEYDGKGSTYLVYTVDDPARMAKMAKAFGTTPEAIYTFNKKLVHTDDKGNKYFIAGTKIKIPRELRPDTKYLQARGSQAYEKARGNELWGEITEMVEEDRESREDSLVRIYSNKNYSNFEQLAIALFQQEGVEKPNRYQVDARVKDLKSLNPNLNDGELKGQNVRIKYNAEKEADVHRERLEIEEQEYQAKLRKENAEGSRVAQEIYNFIDDKTAAPNKNEFWTLLRKVKANNVVSFLEQYKTLTKGKSVFEDINSEYASNENISTALNNILNVLHERFMNSGINNDNLTKLYYEAQSHIQNHNISELDNVVNKMCSQIRLLEGNFREEIATNRTHNPQAVGTSLSGLSMHVETANDTLDYFNKFEETFCGRIWEGTKWLFSGGNAKNLDENVKKDITNFSKYIQQLNTAYKKDGENGFKAEFYKIFGVEFDPKVAESFAIKFENYQKSVAITDVLNSLDNFIKPWQLENLSLNNLKECCKLVIQKIDPNKNPDEFIQELLQKHLGNNYQNASVDKQRASLYNSLNSFVNSMKSELKTSSRGKSIAELKTDLANHSGDLFGTKHDMMNRVNNYIASQKAGSAYVSTGLKIAAMAAFGLYGGGFVMSFGGTFASSSAIDLINMAPDEKLTGSKAWDIFSNAVLDGAFSGTGTFIRDSFKAGKIIGFKNFKKYSYIKQQAVLTSADSSVSMSNASLRGNLNGENAGITLLWSAIAHVASTKAVGKLGLSGNIKSNVERAFRRTGKGVGKEQRLGLKDFISDETIANNVYSPDWIKKQVTNYLENITNIGNLNSIKRFVANIPDDVKDKPELISMVENRISELMNNPQLITIEKVPISDETRNRAISALNQPAPHLTPDQVNDITNYIESLTDKNAFCSAVAQLKSHGINFNEESELKYVVDDKFAELQIKPQYDMNPNMFYYAKQTPNIGNNTPQMSASVLNTPDATIVDTPELDKYTNPDTKIIITQLDPNSLFLLKEDLTRAVVTLSNTQDVQKLIARLDFIQNSKQKTELINFVNIKAREQGILA